VPEPEVTGPAYKVIEVPDVCALVIVAVKVDTKPITSIRVNTKKIRFFIIIIFNNLSLIVLKRFSVVEKTATAINHLARCTEKCKRLPRVKLIFFLVNFGRYCSLSAL
jgi:hypothetical protein